MEDANPSSEVVREMIVAHLVRRSVPRGLITDDASFTADLEIDSLDLHALATEIEDEFGVKITQRDATRIVTVGEAIAFVVGSRRRSVV